MAKTTKTAAKTPSAKTKAKPATKTAAKATAKAPAPKAKVAAPKAKAAAPKAKAAASTTAKPKTAAKTPAAPPAPAQSRRIAHRLARAAAPQPAPSAAASGPEVGDPAPAFSLPATGDRTASTEALKGKPFVVYFYPKADTPGCTTEACDFNEALTQFQGLGLEVIGISKDPIPALEKFAAKYKLSFPLASDPDGAVAQAYGAWGEKVFMGRRSVGLIRSTFLVDKEGRIAKAWKKVKVEGHAAEVLEAAKALG